MFLVSNLYDIWGVNFFPQLKFLNFLCNKNLKRTSFLTFNVSTCIFFYFLVANALFWNEISDLSLILYVADICSTLQLPSEWRYMAFISVIRYCSSFWDGRIACKLSAFKRWGNWTRKGVCVLFLLLLHNLSPPLSLLLVFVLPILPPPQPSSVSSWVPLFLLLYLLPFFFTSCSSTFSSSSNFIIENCNKKSLWLGFEPSNRLAVNFCVKANAICVIVLNAYLPTCPK